MSLAYKIFVTSPSDYWLTPSQKAIKQKIVEKLLADGFEVELMGELGMPYTQVPVWDFERTERIMRCCQGCIVIGFPRWHDAVVIHNESVIDQGNLITEFSHFEGALAYARHLPILSLIENGIPTRGILHDSQPFVGIPRAADESFVTHDEKFTRSYARWRDQVKKRYHIFFGYSGAASGTAALIIKFLKNRGVQVRDWQDFQTTGSILQQIKNADQSCLGGLFLMTADDSQTKEGSTILVPRDNVVFEAGYLINSKGEERVQIILEQGAKLLADLGSQIYLSLADRNNIASIETKLMTFIEERLSIIS